MRKGAASLRFEWKSEDVRSSIERRRTISLLANHNLLQMIRDCATRERNMMVVWGVNCRLDKKNVSALRCAGDEGSGVGMGSP